MYVRRQADLGRGTTDKEERDETDGGLESLKALTALYLTRSNELYAVLKEGEAEPEGSD